MRAATHRNWAVLATVVLTAAVAYGFHVVGSPESRRLEKLDERRVEDLRTIVRAMQDLVWDDDADRLKRPLPTNLFTVRDDARGRRPSIEDPASGREYGFQVLDEHRYMLCAEFDTRRQGELQAFWNHPAGTHCFTIDVRDPP